MALVRRLLTCCTAMCLYMAVCEALTPYDKQRLNYIKYLAVYEGSGASTTDFLPLSDMSTTLAVTVDMTIYSLDSFDEVAGSITLIGALNISWQDELALDPSRIDFVYDNTTKMDFLVPYNKIWTPTLVLSNSVNSIEAVGSSAFLCRFNMASGMVTWKPRVVIEGACTPDVTYFPFDKQSCSFSYVVWEYTATEVSIKHGFNEWDLSEYEENGVWSVIETKTESFVKNSQSVLKLSLVIERKPLYYAFNIILPVLVLCALNAMVFWLPVESGERVGFSVTCFLSFVVLLNMIMGMLPRTSSPISYLCYYLVVMMGLSGLTTAAVVVEMRIFYKNNNSTVPAWIQAFIRFWHSIRQRCVTCVRKSTVGQSDEQRSVTSETSSVKSLTSTVSTFITIDDNSKKTIRGNANNNSECVDCNSKDRKPKTIEESAEIQVDADDAANCEITWPEVGRFLDFFLFVSFTGVQAFFTVTFLVPLRSRA